MPYRHATERSDGSDFASGFVLHSAPNHPAFPVRLATELFLRALEHLPTPTGPGSGPGVTLWDPCCGSGHLATVLGWCHRRTIGRVVASDVDGETLSLARKNLRLLSPEGLLDRERERLELSVRFDKPAYAEAARAAHRLAGRLAEDGGALPWSAGRADVFDPASLSALLASAAPGGAAPDVVVMDVPYGERTHWGGQAPERPVPALLRSLAAVLPPHAVIAVADRARKIPVAPLRPLERLRIGTRSAVLVRAADVPLPD